jgi:hypothetical protein
MMYIFRCGTCGEYPVSEHTAKKFLTADLQKEADKQLKAGAAGIVLTFVNGCPRCTPDNADAQIILSVLWPRKN